jgi:hypothetical protein
VKEIHENIFFQDKHNLEREAYRLVNAALVVVVKYRLVKAALVVVKNRRDS